MEGRKKPQKAESTAVGNEATVRSGFGAPIPPAGPEPASSTVLPLAEVFVFFVSGIAY